MRYEAWAGMGLPKAWAENMGREAGDSVWPIVDSETCGPINGWPTPEQMLCWCPSSEKQSQVLKELNKKEQP